MAPINMNCESDRPRKRPISPEKQRAQVENARRSTGARTSEGAAISSRNRTGEGLACSAKLPKLTFLPGESSEEFDAEVARWCVEMNARTESERFQIRIAVYEKLKYERNINATAAAGREAIGRIRNQSDDAAALAARALVPLLPLKPYETHIKLRQTSHGCAFLLGQWRLIRERLKTHHSLEVSQRPYALQLSGRNPSEILTDAVVYEFNRWYLGALGGPGSYTAAEAANALLLDRPAELPEEEFIRRLEPMVASLPSIAEGHAKLVQFADQQIDDLAERVELLRLRERLDRKRDVIKTGTDASAAGEKRERYRGQSFRQHGGAIRLLHTMQDVRRKHGTGDPAPQDPLQYEPTVPQVDDTVEDQTTAFAVSDPPDQTAAAPAAPSAGPLVPPPTAPVLESPSEVAPTGDSLPPTPRPSAPMLDSPEEIRAAYRAHAQQVADRVARAFEADGRPPWEAGSARLLPSRPSPGDGQEARLEPRAP
jgi:hypothetical protein